MSFILQALKKVEQQHAEAKSGQRSNPTGKGEARHRWPWVVALLLTAGAMLSAGIMLGRSDKALQPMASQWQTAEIPVVKQVANTEPTPMTPQKRVAVEVVEPDLFKEEEASVLAMPTEITSKSKPDKVSSDQLGQAPHNLPAMNIDIHSLSKENPAKSYVLINMQRYRVGDRTDEGAVVNDIVVDGAILEYQGSYFLLPLH